jgi:hypothetical protein
MGKRVTVDVGLGDYFALILIASCIVAFLGSIAVSIQQQTLVQQQFIGVCGGTNGD